VIGASRVIRSGHLTMRHFEHVAFASIANCLHRELASVAGGRHTREVPVWNNCSNKAMQLPFSVPSSSPSSVLRPLTILRDDTALADRALRQLRPLTRTQRSSISPHARTKVGISQVAVVVRAGPTLAIRVAANDAS
jgi:hypothetical protein